MTNVVGEIVGIIEEVRSDARFKEFESVMLYDIETADFGFLGGISYDFITTNLTWEKNVVTKRFIKRQIKYLQKT